MSNTNGPEVVGKTINDLKSVGDAAQQVGQQAKQAGSDAVGHAMDIAQDAKEKAGSMAGAIGEKASSMAEARKGDLADKLEDVAKAVHRSGTQLEGHQDWVAHFVERGAAELNVLATTLRTNDLQSLLGNLGSLARRQPALFVGATMAAGFALTRVGRLAVSAPSASVPAFSAPVPGGIPASGPPKLPATAPSGIPAGDQ